MFSGDILAAFRKLTLAVALALAAVLTWPNGVAALEEYNVDESGYILHGMDPVAYHVAGKAIRGSDEFTETFRGARIRFASAANRDIFKANPEMYMPAYGGWCSYGVRVGKKFDIDPAVFRVVDGRLYVQLDQGTQKVWLQEMEKNIAIADRLWPSIERVSRQTLEK